EARQATLVGSVSATRTQLAEELLSEDVLRGVAAPAGPQREGLGEMALAQAGSADEQDVLCARHELAGCDVEHLRLGDLGVELEVEVLERADLLEASAADTLLDLLGVAAVDLVLEQAHEELEVRQVVLGSLALPDVETLEQAAQSQLLEDGVEVVKQSHDLPPGRRTSRTILSLLPATDSSGHNGARCAPGSLRPFERRPAALCPMRQSLVKHPPPGAAGHEPAQRCV